MSPELTRCFTELGIPLNLPLERGLVEFSEASLLVVADTAENGRTFLLTAEAAQAWQNMKAAAQQQAIALRMVSAFRSVQYQCEVIRRKMERGFTIEETMKVLAPPGFSEHHTGRAVDITTTGIVAVQQEFETTRAFDWLVAHAAEFGFVLSFPKNNVFGYVYEPWHWCFRGVV